VRRGESPESQPDLIIPNLHPAPSHNPSHLIRIESIGHCVFDAILSA